MLPASSMYPVVCAGNQVPNIAGGGRCPVISQQEEDTASETKINEHSHPVVWRSPSQCGSPLPIWQLSGETHTEGLVSVLCVLGILVYPHPQLTC